MNNIASVLITGGTGSLGRALVSRFLADGVPRICIYSRDEFKQAEMRGEIADPQKRLRWFIGDVRDRTRLHRAMNGVDTVIHAAALKRVEVAEFDATEVAKTNVLGTMNLIEAATDAGVARVLAISSDKACAPVNAYGASKLLMEKIVLAANNARGDYGPRFSVLRCGNFLGSRGSVIPMWRVMGHRVPITDHRCTRFVILPRQIVDVVCRTLQTMVGGELVLPPMDAFRITDLALAMGKEWYEIGLRPGERLHEPIDEAHSSENARMLTVDEIRTLLKEIR